MKSYKFSSNGLEKAFEDGKIKNRAKNHFIENKTTYIHAGLLTVALAGVPGDVFAASGIDAKGMQIYYKLAKYGKWVIIVKGAIDVIQSVAQGDFQSGRKNLLGYLVTYGILLAFPHAMAEVDGLFK